VASRSGTSSAARREIVCSISRDCAVSGMRKTSCGLEGVSDLALLSLEVEQIGRPDRLARKTATSRHDRRDAASRRFHPPHPDPQQVLAAVTRLPR
jgi:hypothetical protein